MKRITEKFETIIGPNVLPPNWTWSGIESDGRMLAVDQFDEGFAERWMRIFIRCSAQLAFLTLFIRKCLKGHRLNSPHYDAMEIDLLIAAFPSPLRLELMLRKSARQCNRILDGYGLSFNPHRRAHARLLAEAIGLKPVYRKVQTEQVDRKSYDRLRTEGMRGIRLSWFAYIREDSKESSSGLTLGEVERQDNGDVFKKTSLLQPARVSRNPAKIGKRLAALILREHLPGLKTNKVTEILVQARGFKKFESYGPAPLVWASERVGEGTFSCLDEAFQTLGQRLVHQVLPAPDAIRNRDFSGYYTDGYSNWCTRRDVWVDMQKKRAYWIGELEVDYYRGKTSIHLVVERGVPPASGQGICAHESPPEGRRYVAYAVCYVLPPR